MVSFPFLQVFIELGHEDGQKMLLLACYLRFFIIVSDEAVRSS